MVKNILKKYIAICIAVVFSVNAFSQVEDGEVNIEDLTLEQMKGFTQDDLVQFSFEELIALVKKFKLSSLDELYALLNPSQSTASKLKEDVFDAPLATSVLTAKELEQSGARSIPEALRLVPGIIVREKTNGNYDVHIRGNDYTPPGSDITNSVNSTTLIMIDNQPVYNNFLGATFWENLPIDVYDLEKIEIIYGPASALYGPNAVSGVIHLITKENDSNGLKSNIAVKAGNNNEQNVYGFVSHKKGNLSIKLSANYQNADRFQNTYYIPQMDTTVSGEIAAEMNAILDTTFDASSLDSDYSNAKRKGAVNLFVNYTPSDKLRIDYTGSYQNSSVQTAYMDIGTILSTRKSSTVSNNLNLTAGNFDANVSGIVGHTNAVEGVTGYEYDFTELNGKLGYNFKYKNLVIRPGIDANYATYSDEKYVDEENVGMLNGDATTGAVQGSLRLDYTAFEKLRLIGAFMQGYFYELEKNYNSYQFTTSYKITDKTLLRAVASKANAGLFVLNTYMDKQTEIPMPRGDGKIVINTIGNKDLEPLEMQMFEFGVRQRFGKKIQGDLSLFYNKAENYAQLVNSQDEGTSGEFEPGGDIEITETMQNITMTSAQLGVTISVKYVPNEKFNANVFATFQNTELSGFEVADSVYYTGLTGDTRGKDDLISDPANLTFDHDYTPKFYGGASFNYQPTEQWNFNVSLYGYGKQKSFYTFGQDFMNVAIDSKILANLHVSYNVNDWLSVSLTGRNITNSKAPEFIFVDETGMSVLGGVNLKF